ncbi:MAG TPA: Crp/Fnr family transcriptional regulator [Allosphingosinicella sp.]|jgi:CRP-like cAMP-binding protein
MPNRLLTSVSLFEPMILRLESLAPLSFEEREAIRALPHSLERVEHGTGLVRIGETQDRCCLLVSAYAYKHKVTGAGAKQILAINLPGEILNVQSALDFRSDFDAHAFKPGEVAFIPAEAMRELIFNYASIARAMWLHTHAEAAVSREWLLNATRRDFVTRAAHLLCETSTRLEVTRVDDSDRFFIPLSVEELAQANGSVPLYVGRALSKLEEQQAIRLEQGGIRILDWLGLTRLADFDPLYLLDRPVAAAG